MIVVQILLWNTKVLVALAFGRCVSSIFSGRSYPSIVQSFISTLFSRFFLVPFLWLSLQPILYLTSLTLDHLPYQLHRLQTPCSTDLKMAPTPSPTGGRGGGGGSPGDDNDNGPKNNIPLIAIVIVLIVAAVFFVSVAICVYRKRQARERRRRRVAQHYSRLGRYDKVAGSSSDGSSRGHRSTRSDASMSVRASSDNPLPPLPAPVYEVPRVQTHDGGLGPPPSYRPVDADTSANNPWVVGWR